MGRPLKRDLTNLRFGMLKVLGRSPVQGPTGSGGSPMWLCRCDCGTLCLKRGGGLNRGTVNSCGCLRGIFNRRVRTTHGKAAGSHSRVYRIWNAMKQRCYNANQSHYERYGGRGITVCDEWRESFAAFYRDMGDPPPGHSIERNDNDGPYAPWNCRWATPAEQRLNQRPRQKT